MTAKKPAVKNSIEIAADRNVFAVTVKGANIWDHDTFEFTIDSDGDVTLNDYVFSSKKQAAQVFEAMAKFLSK
jgi:hypothetical protein